MKISKKLIVSALSTGMGVSLVGAITGTVAWYQYSTRSTVSFIGTSVGTSENLLVSFQENADYKNDLYVSDDTVELAPVTTGNILKTDAIGSTFKFKAQPIYQKFGYDKWVDADSNSYVHFTLYLRLDQLDDNGQFSPVTDERTVYLSDLVIDDANAANSSKEDITDAIRVHIGSYNENMLISNHGLTTDTNGKLDLNNDGRLDTANPAYIFNDNDPAVDYGEGVQTAYKPSDVLATEGQGGVLSGAHNIGTFNSAQLVTFEENQDFENGVVYYEDAQMQTPTADEHAIADKNYYIHRNVIAVTVTIWLEGWQKFDRIRSTKLAADYDLDNSEVEYFTDAACNTPATGSADANTTYYFHSSEAMWDPTLYVGSMFNIGLMFEVNANL